MTNLEKWLNEHIECVNENEETQMGNFLETIIPNCDICPVEGTCSGIKEGEDKVPEMCIDNLKEWANKEN